jgi:hypothetical protein
LFAIVTGDEMKGFTVHSKSNAVTFMDINEPNQAHLALTQDPSEVRRCQSVAAEWKEETRKMKTTTRFSQSQKILLIFFFVAYSLLIQPFS